MHSEQRYIFSASEEYETNIKKRFVSEAVIIVLALFEVPYISQENTFYWILSSRKKLSNLSVDYYKLIEKSKVLQIAMVVDGNYVLHISKWVLNFQAEPSPPPHPRPVFYHGNISV